MEKQRGHIVIAGSVNMDVSLSVDRIPAPGETVLATSMRVSGGGKAGNQAVAAARLGGRVALLARLGKDAYAERLQANFRSAGIDLSGLSVDPEAPTGQAYIAVAASGENNIIVVPGANRRLLPDTVDAAETVLHGASFVSVQLETPLDTVQRLAALCRRLRIPLALNPSPAMELPEDLLAAVSLLILNEHELVLLAGRADEDTMLKRLLALGIETVVLTKGGAGAVLAHADRMDRFPARRVDVVDTTGAGDTFTGGLLVALAEGKPLAEAIEFAQAAAAIQVTRPGAQDAVPSRDEVDRLLGSVR